MKPITRRIAGCAAFLLLLLAILILFSRIMQPKGNRREDGIQDPVANGILSETPQSIDVLFLGDSESYCAFIPLQLFKDHGITGYVCGTSLQTLGYSFEFLEKTFQNQTPKVVVLETNAIFRDEGLSQEIARQAELLLPIFRYHDRWKKLITGQSTKASKYSFLDGSKGYIFDVSQNPANTKDYMSPSDAVASIPAINNRYVESMKQFCQTHDATLLLISVPSTVNWRSERHNAIAAFAEKMDLHYIDCNMLRSEIPIDWTMDTRDKGDHLNHFGASKVTKYLGDYLASLSLFSDKRKDPSYANWTAAVSEFETIIGMPLE